MASPSPQARRYERIANTALVLALLVFLVSDLVPLIQHHYSAWTVLRIVLEIGLVIFYTRQVRKITRGNPKTPTDT